MIEILAGRHEFRVLHESLIQGGHVLPTTPSRLHGELKFARTSVLSIQDSHEHSLEMRTFIVKGHCLGLTAPGKRMGSHNQKRDHAEAAQLGQVDQENPLQL